MKYEVGQRVGEWTLLEYRPSKCERRGDRWACVRPRAWKCQCSCGVLRMVQQDNLTSGKSLSCGHDRQRLVRQHAALNLRPVNSVFALGGQS